MDNQPESSVDPNGLIPTRISPGGTQFETYRNIDPQAGGFGSDWGMYGGAGDIDFTSLSGISYDPLNLRAGAGFAELVEAAEERSRERIMGETTGTEDDNTGGTESQNNGSSAGATDAGISPNASLSENPDPNPDPDVSTPEKQTV